MTGNQLKFEEIRGMASLYGCAVEQVGADFDPKRLGPRDAAVCEQTRLLEEHGGRVVHESRVWAQTVEGTKEWMERVKGVLLAEEAEADPSVYGWDKRFYPVGSKKSLHELKCMGLKVSARQLAIGAWLKDWLEYDAPVHWNHIPPAKDVAGWLASEPLMAHPELAPVRRAFERVHEGGAWFKEATNRRSKHYWWPGLNAGIPMVPKRDRVHETTFLVHDLFHWTMPDPLLSGPDLRSRRTYVALRMMSEAVTMVMADMVFAQKAKQAGLEYDFAARKIHPVYDPEVPVRDWCKAMSVYAVLGDDSQLAKIAKSEEALSAFKEKFGPFFEEDLRWTAHNARHLAKELLPGWVDCARRFAAGCGLGFSETDDYASCWSDSDAALVDNLFDALWDRHWKGGEMDGGTAQVPAGAGDCPEMPQARARQRWLCGQLALAYRMWDLPVSRAVAKQIESACLGGDPEAIGECVELWENYVDALEGLNRLSVNDAALFKAYYPIVPPLYVSYDRDKATYGGIAAMWEQARQ